MLERALQEAKLLEVHANPLPQTVTGTLQTILVREPGLGDALTTFAEQHTFPKGRVLILHQTSQTPCEDTQALSVWSDMFVCHMDAVCRL